MNFDNFEVAQAAGDIHKLSRTETAIMARIAGGLSITVISETMSISEHVVSLVLKSAVTKLDARNTIHAVCIFQRSCQVVEVGKKNGSKDFSARVA